MATSDVLLFVVSCAAVMLGMGWQRAAQASEYWEKAWREELTRRVDAQFRAYDAERATPGSGGGVGTDG